MTNSLKPFVEIYTDGACSGNPGPGGWGALLRFNDVEKELSGAETNTTNNRMELMAAIQALLQLRQSCQVKLVTDSEYLRKGVMEWLPRWKQNAWRTSQKKPVKNVDLWQQLDAVISKHDIEWYWVRGHNGDVDNERVDKLARHAIKNLTGQNGL